jgi:hypothetical protein
MREIRMFEDWITDIKKKFWIDLFFMICPMGNSESFSNMTVSYARHAFGTIDESIASIKLKIRFQKPPKPSL